MVTTDVKTEFDRLVKEWYRKVGHFSNPEVHFKHPNYKKILDLGPEIIPFIFEELKKDRGLWYDALYELTGECPAPRNMKSSAKRDELWMAWGRARGYTK